MIRAHPRSSGLPATANSFRMRTSKPTPRLPMHLKSKIRHLLAPNVRGACPDLRGVGGSLTTHRSPLTKSFRFRTYRRTPRFARSWPKLSAYNSFRMRSSRLRACNPFRMRTCEKNRGRGFRQLKAQSFVGDCPALLTVHGESAATTRRWVKNSPRASPNLQRNGTPHHYWSSKNACTEGQRPRLSDREDGAKQSGKESRTVKSFTVKQLNLLETERGGTRRLV